MVNTMRRLGVIGGMSWESTVTYYQALNRGVRDRLGGLHSADLVLHSVDFAPIEACQRSGDWNQAGAMLAQSARDLVAAGAQGLVLATNTMHKVASGIESAVDVPLIHLIDTTAARVRAGGYKTVGVLGTRFTMEQPFYRDRLEAASGAHMIAPGGDDRAQVDRIIFEELCLGDIRPASQAAYRAVMERLVAQGAEAIILGCTEITLLVDAADASVPLIDSTAVHVEAALDWMLG